MIIDILYKGFRLTAQVGTGIARALLEMAGESELPELGCGIVVDNFEGNEYAVVNSHGKYHLAMRPVRKTVIEIGKIKAHHDTSCKFCKYLFTVYLQRKSLEVYDVYMHNEGDRQTITSIPPCKQNTAYLIMRLAKMFEDVEYDGKGQIVWSDK